MSFMTKPQLPNLQQAVANTILSINISNSKNLNKFWVRIFTRQGQSINSSLLNGTELVSDGVSDKGSQRSDSGSIKKKW